MVSVFTPNVGLEEPARGDYVGTWDLPVNGNMTLLDLVVGGRTTISGAAGSVVLAAAQYQCKTITINSTLTTSIALTFPTSFTKSYEVYHSCTGSSAFTITLQTTAAGGQVVAIPPGEICEVVNDGTNIRFKNFGRVGSYWDYGGSSVPAWVSACTVPPYLYCDASTFSSATYPQLATVLGSTTLPDGRGRVRAAIDGGTARLSSAVAGFNPNTVGAGGGSQNYQQHNHNLTLTDPGHTHPWFNYDGGSVNAGGGFGGIKVPDTITSNVTGITVVSSAAGTGTAGNVQPTYIGGITMIRAA